MTRQAVGAPATNTSGEMKLEKRRRHLLNGIYEFTVNFGFDLFTNVFLIRSCASVDFR